MLAGIEALSWLANGAVTVLPDSVSVTGQTGNATARDEIARLFIEKLGQDAQFTIDVAYVEALDPIAGLPTPEECVNQILVVTEGRKITFEPGSATLNADAVPIMDDIAEVLRLCGDLRLRISGYTDSQGRDEMNLSLSQDRAESVLDALRMRRVPVAAFEAVGYGEANPIADNETEEGREANRRIEFSLIVPEGVEEPTTLERMEQQLPEGAPDAGDDAPGVVARATLTVTPVDVMPAEAMAAEAMPRPETRPRARPQDRPELSSVPQEEPAPGADAEAATPADPADVAPEPETAAPEDAGAETDPADIAGGEAAADAPDDPVAPDALPADDAEGGGAATPAASNTPQEDAPTPAPESATTEVVTAAPQQTMPAVDPEAAEAVPVVAPEAAEALPEAPAEAEVSAVAAPAETPAPVTEPSADGQPETAPAPEGEVAAAEPATADGPAAQTEPAAAQEPEPESAPAPVANAMEAPPATRPQARPAAAGE